MGKRIQIATAKNLNKKHRAKAEHVGRFNSSKGKTVLGKEPEQSKRREQVGRNYHISAVHVNHSRREHDAITLIFPRRVGEIRRRLGKTK